jgi:hypothetical protein
MADHIGCREARGRSYWFQRYRRSRTLRGMKTQLALMLLAFTACSKKDSASEGKAGGASQALADFDVAAIAKKFDGKTFVITASMGKQVWSFANGKVTIVEGETEKVGDLEVRSPCSLAVRTKRSDGLEDINEKAFAWNGDTLYMGSGWGGAKKGDSYVACYGLDVYTLKGGSCAFQGKSAKCAVKDGKLVTDNATFEIVGDALVDNSLKGSVAELAPSLADAKVKLSAR